MVQDVAADDGDIVKAAVVDLASRAIDLLLVQLLIQWGKIANKPGCSATEIFGILAIILVQKKMHCSEKKSEKYGNNNNEIIAGKKRQVMHSNKLNHNDTTVP